MALIVDLRHFLNEDGSMADMASPARTLAEYLGRIVKAVTTRKKMHWLLVLGVEKDVGAENAQERSLPL